MEKKIRKTLALFLALALSLTACGGKQGEESKSPENSAAVEGTPSVTDTQAVTDYVEWQLSSTEMENMLPLHSEASADLKVLINCYSTLLENDSTGKLVPGIAESWEKNEDASVWTFHLRKGVHWVDYQGNEKDECTSEDWKTSMEWILNFHKNEAKNTSMLNATVAGASEYYNYTKELSETEAKALTWDNPEFAKVGIETPDDYTIVYHCSQPTPYFETLFTSACFFPLPQGQVDEIGVDATLGQTFQNMWFNGPYRMVDFIHGNSKRLEKNESYWDTESTRFDSVTVKMVQDGNTDDQLFMTGEVDTCDLSEGNLRIIYNDQGHEYHNNLVQRRMLSQNRAIQFNYAKKNADGSWDDNWNAAVANEAFRLAFYYGMELTPYWARTNLVSPQDNEALTFTTRNVVSFSDGRDYQDRVIELLGLTGGGRYDKDKAAQYVAQAKSELAGKVTFPVAVDFYVPANNQDEIDKGTVLKQVIEDGLGTDFVTVEIKTYVSNARQEIYNPQLHCFGIAGWYADYGDPENFITQFMYQNDSAYFASVITKESQCTDPGLIAQWEEYNRLCDIGNNIVDDMDARYEAQAQAEAYLISHALIIPCYSLSQWSLTRVHNFNAPFASYGCDVYLFKNYASQAEPYTTEQFAQLHAGEGK